MQDVIAGITGVLNTFVNGAAQFGLNLLKNIASGITAGIGNVKSAMGNAISAIGNLLPHSPAKEGELVHLNEYGPTIMTALQQGLESGIPALKATIAHVVAPMAQIGTPQFSGGAHTFQLPAMQAQQPPQIIVQSPPIMLDGRLLANGLMPYQVNAIRYATGIRGV